MRRPLHNHLPWTRRWVPFRRRLGGSHPGENPRQLNPAGAEEWIWPHPPRDAAKPWVFLVDADGNVVQRCDNVGTEAGLAGAVAAVVGG